MSETVTVPRAQFAAQAAKKSAAFIADMEADQPRADALAAQLEALAAEARSKGVMLDDVSVAQNKDAADLRARIDPLIVELNTLSARHAHRIKTNQAVLAALDGGKETDPVVTVPIAVAMTVLDLEIAI